MPYLCIAVCPYHKQTVEVLYNIMFVCRCFVLNDLLILYFLKLTHLFLQHIYRNSTYHIWCLEHEEFNMYPSINTRWDLFLINIPPPFLFDLPCYTILSSVCIIPFARNFITNVTYVLLNVSFYVAELLSN